MDFWRLLQFFVFSTISNEINWKLVNSFQILTCLCPIYILSVFSFLQIFFYHFYQINKKSSTKNAKIDWFDLVKSHFYHIKLIFITGYFIGNKKNNWWATQCVHTLTRFTAIHRRNKIASTINKCDAIMGLSDIFTHLFIAHTAHI